MPSCGALARVGGLLVFVACLVLNLPEAVVYVIAIAVLFRVFHTFSPIPGRTVPKLVRK